MSLGTVLLASTLLENVLAGKGIVRTGYGNIQGEGTVRAGYVSSIKIALIPPHPLTNFEIQKYYQNELRFNGVYSRDSLPKK